MSTSAEAGRRFISTRAEGIALVLFTACSWGLTWPQTKYLIGLVPAFSARAACGIAGCVFAFMVAFLRRENVLPPRDQWVRLIAYAMMNYGLFIVLTTQSLKGLKASEAVTITYTLPVWASLLAWPMLGERPTWTKIVALVLALGGVTLLVGADSAEATWEKVPAALMAFAAAVMFGLATVLAKKHPLRLPPATSVAWQAGFGMIPVVAIAWFETPDWNRVTLLGWAAIAYISSIPLTIAYLAWFRALRMVPASMAATTVLVSPMIGVLGSGLLLGETFGPRQILGLAMTLTGVALAARG
ncbi:MAG: EamA family transporter [Proteobacteria bacterium]|nr:EamA family transporter [Pseudomonadota bacterium]